MRAWLKKWLFAEELEQKTRDAFAPIASPEEAVLKTQPKVRIGMVEAMNGKMLEVSTYKRNPHGPDWTSEYFVLDPATPLSEQIATVMVMKGLSV